MGKLRRIIGSLTLLVLLTVGRVCGQTNPSVEELTFSYFSVFDLSTGLPEQSIRRTLRDTLGRLWLQGSRDAELNNILPFVFNGSDYAFLDTTQFPLSPFSVSHIHGISHSGLWYGVFRSGVKSTLFTFSPISKKAEQVRVDIDSNVQGYVASITEGAQDEIIVLTSDSVGFYVYMVKNEELEKITFVARTMPMGPGRPEVGLPLLADENEIWFGDCRQPIYRFDRRTNTIETYSPITADLTEVIELQTPGFSRLFDGTVLYFHPAGEDGIFYFNKETNSFEIWDEIPVDFRFFANTSVSGKLSHIPRPLYLDDVGNLLLLYASEDNRPKALIRTPNGTWLDCSSIVSQVKGNIGNFDSADFLQEIQISTNQGLIVSGVKTQNNVWKALKTETRSIVQADSILYVTSPGHGGLAKISLMTGKEIPINLSQYGYDSGLNNVQSVRIGSEIWVPVTNGRVIIDGATGAFKERVEYEGFTHLWEVEGDLFGITNDGMLLSIIAQERKVSPLNNGVVIPSAKSIRDIETVGRTTVFGTNSGLVLYNHENDSIRIYGTKDGLIDSNVQCLEVLENGELVIGFFGAGIQYFNLENGAGTVVGLANGLSNGTITAILEDDENRLWVATYNGLNILVDRNKVVRKLYKGDGLSTSEFNRFSSTRLADGRMVFGSILGVNIFDPNELFKSVKLQRDVRIYPFYCEYYPYNEDSLRYIQTPSELPQLIELSPERANLSLTFGLSDYLFPDNQEYAYRLRNISEKWISLGGQKQLNLFNLTPGTYDLEIIGYDIRGVSSDRPLSTKIIVHRFFYQTWWFILIIVAPIAMVAMAWFRRLRNEKINLELEVEKATEKISKDNQVIAAQAERLQDLDEIKSRFFTNVSHEFRTPITVIQGMTELIDKDPKQWTEKGVKIIHRNSSSLLDLVNKILDIRKLESGEIRINLVHGDIVVYLNYISESFVSHAASLEVSMKFKSMVASIGMDYDQQHMLSIVSNLLSNAIKNTPRGGDITINVNEKEQKLILEVIDTGRGIKTEDLPYVFDQFYQTGSGASGVGSGIGLAYTKELVDKLGGEISVSSEENMGTIFTLMLPIQHNSEKQPDSFEGPKMEVVDMNESYSIPPHIDNLPTLLIVEDNKDVAEYIIACMSSRYNIYAAGDGQQGILLAIQHVPDAIISDVMMPIKDGFVLCKTLKSDQRTSHIPIVLLTAKADEESRFEGLSYGADAYLSKPFNREELLIRIEKLIEIRLTLQNKYKSFVPQPQAGVSLNLEELFISRIHELIEEHLDDSKYGINEVCSDLGISRTQLHQKLKALTGRSTSIYIRSIRLDHSKGMVTNSRLTISEIAYSVGFEDPSYFTRTFTEEFGMSPSQMREQAS